MVLVVEELFLVNHLDTFDYVEQSRVYLIFEFIQHNLSADCILELQLNGTETIYNCVFAPLDEVALGCAQIEKDFTIVNHDLVELRRPHSNLVKHFMR
jgi:hypothetical protein